MSIFFFNLLLTSILFIFFFNDTATTEIYTLSLHDALPILVLQRTEPDRAGSCRGLDLWRGRSEEHTSELQSLAYLVCRLLLEKKKKQGEIQCSNTRLSVENELWECLCFMWLIQSE